MSESNGKIIIKRYRNRKLYDTQHSAYVTLDDIAEMVREQKDIQVLENDTLEDITSATLAQILFEREKRSRGFLTLGELNRIIRERSQKVRDFVEKNLPTEKLNLDDISMSGFYDEIEKQVGRIFKSGGVEPEEQQKSIRRLFTAPQQNLEEFFERVEKKVHEGFDKLTHVDAMREEFNSLNRRLRHLERELRQMQPKEAASDEDAEEGEGGSTPPPRANRTRGAA